MKDQGVSRRSFPKATVPTPSVAARHLPLTGGVGPRRFFRFFLIAQKETRRPQTAKSPKRCRNIADGPVAERRAATWGRPYGRAHSTLRDHAAARSRPARFLLSRCGLGARPGRQLLRLRADPVRPAAVPGLCPSAPESVSPVRLSSALLVVTLRRLRNARLPYDSEHKHSGFSPPWFVFLAPVHPRCSARLRASAYLSTPT